MDNTFPSQEVRLMNDKDASVLYHVRHTTGLKRLLYAAYTLLGVLFYGIGIFTFLGLAMRTINGGDFFSPETVVLTCYVLINCLVGYGYIFHRKWLVTLFAIQAVFMGGMTAYSYSSGAVVRGEALLINVGITIGVVLFLFFTRHILSEKYVPLRIILPFIMVLLLSFLLTNVGMLN